MKKVLLKFSLILFGFFLLFGSSLTYGATKPHDMGEIQNIAIQTGRATGLGYSQPGNVIGDLIKFVLGLLGIIFFVLMIYAGIIWMTAAGNEDQIAKAKSTLIQATIGLFIVLAAFAITSFVYNYLFMATMPTAPAVGTPNTITPTPTP